MTALDARDLRGVLELSRQAASVRDLAAFREEMVPALRRLIVADTLGYNEIDLERRRAYTVTDAPAYEGVDRRFLELAHQHPLVPYQHSGDPRARLIADFLGPRAFHRLELYHDIYRPLGIEHQLAFGLSTAGIVTINLGRGRRPFGERDRRVAELARPHLTLAFVRAREQSEFRALLAAADAALEARHTALIHLDGPEIVGLAGPAEDLLAAYFGATAGRRLPEALHRRLGRLDGSAGMTFASRRGRLHVRIPSPPRQGELRTLVLEEQRRMLPSVESLLALGLSARQAQVLRLLAGGRSRTQIATELGIALPTVHKHLERIYDRLGVRSRTEAVTRALSAREHQASGPGG